MKATLMRVVLAWPFLLVAIGCPAFGFIGPHEAQRDNRDLNVVKTNKDTDQPRRYYALVIGIDNYQYLERLETAVRDATNIEKTLQKVYGFNTRLLLNVRRDDIINALNDYQRSLDENTSLLIYYAGHGFRDSKVDKAYWLPADANKVYRTNWISADDITTNIRGIDSKHILVVADSCYSGMMTRESGDGLAPLERGRAFHRLMLQKSRVLISSGGNEPVADGGCEGNSVFACSFIRGLENMAEAEFTAGDLFHKFIRESVAGRSNQIPQYMAILNSGHESGDFVFMRKKSVAELQPISVLNVAGRWSLVTRIFDVYEDSVMRIEQHGASISAYIIERKIGQPDQRTDLTGVSLAGNQIAFTMKIELTKEEQEDRDNPLTYGYKSLALAFSGAVDGDNMAGLLSIQTKHITLTFDWAASRLRNDQTATSTSPSIDKTPTTTQSRPMDEKPLQSLALSSAETVRRVQIALKERGYYEGPIDGIMNPRISDTLSRFQQDNKLPQTGKLDVLTALSLGIKHRW